VTDNLRIVGLQMECSQDIEHNKNQILDCIKSQTNKTTTYIVTPEGALSGYFAGCDLEGTTQAICKIQTACKKYKVGIFLGTILADSEGIRNTAIVIDTHGEIIYNQNKVILVENDVGIGCIAGKTATRPCVLKDAANLTVTTTICNDFWGSAFSSTANNIPSTYIEMHEPDLMIHLTNGMRGMNNFIDDAHFKWHESNLQMQSLFWQIPIVCVDNCYHIDGVFYDGNTSAPSGVWYNGIKVASANTKQQDVFDYTFRIDKLKGQF